MKLKRILATVLCLAMVLSTMSFTVFADDGENGEAADKPVYVAELSKGFGSLQEAVEAIGATQGNYTILLEGNFNETTRYDTAGINKEPVGGFAQYDGVNIVIDGQNKTTWTGTIDFHGNKQSDSKLTIKNIAFTTEETTHDFIKSVEKNKYPSDLLIEGCSFEGPAGDNKVVAVRLKSCENVEIKNCTGTGLHSFLQNTAGWNLTIDNVDVKNMTEGGFALGSVQGVTVKNCDVTAGRYGIRLDAQYNNNAVIENCNAEAYIPVVVRKAEKDSSITFNGTNTMKETNEDGIWCAIAKTEYEPGVSFADDATANVIVTLNDTGLDKSGVEGEYVYAAKIGDTVYPTLQEAIDAAVTGDNTITLGNDFAGEVTILQQDGVNVILNGNGNYFDGTIYIHGNARYEGTETLTIQNVNFVSDETIDFISSNSTGPVERYAHNVKVTGCTFTSTNADADVVGMRYRQAYNMTVENCTFEGMHSAMWADSCSNGITIDGIETIDCKNGISAGQSTKVVVKNSTINATAEGGYGVRVDGTVAGNLTVEETKINAYYPVVVRYATNPGYALNLNAGSDFTSTNSDGYDVVVTTGKDDAALAKPEEDINITIADDVNVNVFSSHVAEVDGKYYKDFVTALKAIKADSVFNLLSDVTISDKWDCRSTGAQVTVPVTINGNGHTLKLIGEVDDKNWNTVFRFEADATVKNLNIDASEATGVQRGISSKGSITVDNCTIIGNGTSAQRAVIFGEGAGSAISDVTATIMNSRFANWSLGISDNQSGKDAKSVSITGNTFENADVNVSASDTITFNGNTKNGGKVIMTSYATEKVLKITAENNDISNVNFYIYATAELKNNSLVDCTYTTKDKTVTIAENYVNNVNDIVDMADMNAIDFVTYYGTEEDLANKANLVDVKEKAAQVYVQYKKTDLDAAGEDNLEGKDVYEIVLAGDNAEKINELASADLTFDFNATPVANGAMDYFVNPAKGVSLSQIGDRYMFNYDGVTYHERTDAEIVIGTITIDGYGSYTLKTDDSEGNKNAVYATKIANNIVDGFKPAADLIINKEMEADGEEDDGMVGKVDAVIAVPVRTLTVNVTFPNAILDQTAAYQDMKVEINGTFDGVSTTRTYNLGTGENAIAMTNGKYVVTDDDLVLDNAYTVTVSGAGYRTARYTVTMTTDKELTFWNNVMDNDTVVEKDVFSQKVNFLAGDIVKDSQINIYDLSAVVSYFGTVDCVKSHPEYAKYDLNRDGVIDSKDVAYVLVSWGK